MMDERNQQYEMVAKTLAKRYDTVYYVDVETDHYTVFASTELYKAFQLPAQGTDFFEEVMTRMLEVVHPEDAGLVRTALDKKAFLYAVDRGNLLPIVYRAKYRDEYIYICMDGLWTDDHRHIIVSFMNVENVERIKREQEKSKQVYMDVATSLAHFYETIFYVNVMTDEFILFPTTDLYKKYDIPKTGKHFFENTAKYMPEIMHPDDRETARAVLDKENMLRIINRDGVLSLTLRNLVDGEYKYFNMRVIWADDHNHIVFAISNVDKQVRREKEQEKKLREAMQRALTDELTGVHNRNAYCELEESLQKEVESGDASPFAIVVCDVNGLKTINDTEGHKTGDEYLQSTSRLIRATYSNSEIFRVGGDEFVVILKNEDYENRDTLLDKIKSAVLENMRQDKSVFAIGMAIHLNGENVTDVFERADQEMYRDKQSLKERDLI